MRMVLEMAVYMVMATASSQVQAGDDEMTIQLAPTSTRALEAAPPETATTALDLDDLIDIALARNVQISVAAAEVAQAKALSELAAAQAFPTGNLTGVFGGPVPEARANNPDTNIHDISEASRMGDFNFGQLGVTMRLTGELVQPLYTFDKIDSLKRAAGHLEKAAEHRRTITEAEVVVNVTKAFWTMQLTRTFVRSLDEGSQTLEKVLERIEEMLDSDTGQVTENDRLRLKYALATLEVRRVEAEAINKVAGQAMRLLLGWAQEEPLQVAQRELDELPESTPELPQLVAWARHHRPELKALKRVVKATEAFTESRKANFLPTLFLGGFLSMAYTSNATDITNPFIYDPYNFFNVGVGLGVRIDLDVFQKLAQLEQAEAELQLREAQTLLASQAVDLDVRRLYTEIEAGYKRINKLERANITARGWLTASALGYDIGTGEADELIDAFLAWAASEAELQTTRFNMITRLVEMSRATGRLVGPGADR